MPVKSKKITVKKTTKKSVSSRTAIANQTLKEKINPEYLVVSVPQLVKEGANFKLLNVSSSYEAAEKFVNELGSTASKLICIVEKKKLIQRIPVMTTSEVERNLASSI